MLALALRLGSALCFSVMFLCVKLATERGVAVPEILFWRQALSAPALGLWLAWQGQLHRLRTQRFGAHARRGLLGMTNIAILFTATSMLPLAETTTFGFTTPLFAVLIAALFFREKIGAWRWSAVALGFCGVLVIAQPGGAQLNLLGAGLALLAALIVAVINYQLRDLGRTEEPICVVFWFGAIGAGLTIFALPFYFKGHDASGWLLMAGLGVSGLIGQLFLTASLRFASVASVVVMDYTSLIWSSLLGWLAWSYLPPFTTWLGAPLIVAAGLTIAWREHQLARRPVAPAETH